MDLEPTEMKNSLEPDDLKSPRMTPPQLGVKGVKSATRIHYEAQVEVIKRQLGSLENIRLNLGLSQRKICQLLMVDPSAWTRWTRWGEGVPPHIYRALQWYMIIQEKIPGLTPQYFVGRDPEILHQKAMLSMQGLEKKIGALEHENQALKSAIQRQRALLWSVTLAALIFVGVLGYRFLRQS